MSITMIMNMIICMYECQNKVVLVGIFSYWLSRLDRT